MKDFLKNEKWTFMSLCLAMIGIIVGCPFVLGAETAPAVDVVASGTTKAVPGQAGVESQVPGAATTVSNIREAGGDLIQPDIDEQITLIGTDETILDGLMRRTKRQVKVSGPIVDHYLIDEAKAVIETTGDYHAQTRKTAKLTVDSADAEYFKEFGTVLCRNVMGYNSAGTSTIPGSCLMLFVVGRDSDDMPIVRAINGPKSSPSDEYCNVPEIPNHTKLVILQNACAETQTEVEPDSVVPKPTTVYLQKSVLNQVISDYFESQKKRIPFSNATIAEALVKEYRRKTNRTLWIGVKGRIKVNRDKVGAQDVFLTEGLRWQFKREWEHLGPWSFADIIALSKLKFTGQSCSKKALWIMGRDLLEDIQNIDFTKHKDITMGSDTVWGFECTKLHTVFGEFYLLHDPTLDAIGYSHSGALIDEQGLVRYWMKNEEAKEEKIQGEEAKRKALISINAIALKGYSHIWVNCEGTSDGLPGVSVVKEHNHESEPPEDPSEGDIYYLKQACSGISSSQQGELWQWKDGEWKKYEGEIFARDESI